MPTSGSYYSNSDAFGDFADDNDDKDHLLDDDVDSSYDLRRHPAGRPRSDDDATMSSSSTSASDIPVSTCTFYSRKSISDLFDNSSNDGGDFFQRLCTAAEISRPSRIQSMAWPHLLRGESCVVADQTGSGKTLAYLLPLLRRLQQRQQQQSGVDVGRKRSANGRPGIVILAPTAELADQIHRVCVMLSENLKSMSSSDVAPTPSSWTFRPFVTTAAGSRVTSIRDQIRMIQSTSIDVLISTPGRLSTILRTRNSGLDLGDVNSLVLDEVDFLLVDETFGPQLRAVGAAVQRDNDGGDGKDVDTDADVEPAITGSTQFVFVTATLPTDVLDAIRAEVPNVTELRGPGLHRITPTVQQTLIDVSVPASMNRDYKAGFDLKVRELIKALRGRRVDRTLVFCNTVETCRDVENALKRNDRGGRRSRVWAYHNALSPENRLKNLHSFSSSSSSREVYDGGSTGGRAYAESVLVCTDRASRGVDFESNPVDHVVLFDFPKDPAEYVRRVGRTARAGRTGASTVLAYGWQLPIARQIMGLSGGGDNKKGKGRGNAKLEGFTMMKSDDGWDGELTDKEDEYYVKGGARKRMEQSETTASSSNRGKNSSTSGGKEKERPTKATNGKRKL